MREALAVGEQGGLPVQITHHKMMGRAAWGKSVETLRLVDEARAASMSLSINILATMIASDGEIPGMKADLVVFDPTRGRDVATFEMPHQYAKGIALVIVNGQAVFENGAMTAARPGQVLYGPAKQ